MNELSAMLDAMSLETWESEAACRDKDSQQFYPEAMGLEGEELGRAIRAAKAICNGCVVLDKCIEYALTDPDCRGDNSIWGGKTQSERKQLRRWTNRV